MVHFAEYSPAHLCIQCAVFLRWRKGLPHSEIPGSKRACRSPGHIAACRVLHRLPMPRHPPCALSNLTTRNMQLPAIRLKVFCVFVCPRGTACCRNSTAVPNLTNHSCVIVKEPLFSQPGTGNSGARLRKLVGVPGLEPGTSSLSGMRSNRLSYTPFDTLCLLRADPAARQTRKMWS